MPWKRDSDNNLVTDDNGDPIFVYPNNNEMGINFDSQYSKITELNRKVLQRDKRISGFDATVKLLSDVGIDISDPNNLTTYLDSAEANAARIQNFNDSDFIKADEVEALKQKEAEKHAALFEKQKTTYEKKLADADAVIAQKDSALHSAIIKNAVLGSEFISSKTSFPNAEVAYEYLKPSLKVETNGNGEAIGIGVDSDGDPIYSLKDPSKKADINEALEIIVRNHPLSSTLLIGDGGGTGTRTSHRTTVTTNEPKVIQRSNKAFIDNLEDIAKGNVVVE